MADNPVPFSLVCHGAKCQKQNSSGLYLNQQLLFPAGIGALHIPSFTRLCEFVTSCDLVLLCGITEVTGSTDRDDLDVPWLLLIDCHSWTAEPKMGPQLVVLQKHRSGHLMSSPIGRLCLVAVAYEETIG